MSDLRLKTRHVRFDTIPGETIRGRSESHQFRSGADLSFDGTPGLGQFTRDYGLRTAVLLSLFCDRLAEPSDELPDARVPATLPDRRGYWADFLSPLGSQDRWGSRLWQLRGRALQPQRTPARARTYALEALQWIRQLGIGTVDVETSIPSRGKLLIEVSIRDAVTQELKRYRVLWDAMNERGV